MSSHTGNKELDILSAYIHKHKSEFFHFCAQHEAVRIKLFCTSLNNNIYPAELSRINCISHFSFEAS